MLTYEHLPKQADTRRYYGPDVRGLYRTDAHNRNELIQGAGARRLKLPGPICNACNSALTQPHDRVWDGVFDYLLTNWEAVAAAGAFDLRANFPANPQQAAVALHMYALKLLGCFASGHSTTVRHV